MIQMIFRRRGIISNTEITRVIEFSTVKPDRKKRNLHYVLIDKSCEPIIDMTNAHVYTKQNRSFYHAWEDIIEFQRSNPNFRGAFLNLNVWMGSLMENILFTPWEILHPNKLVPEHIQMIRNASLQPPGRLLRIKPPDSRRVAKIHKSDLHRKDEMNLRRALLHPEIYEASLHSGQERS